MLTRMTRKTTRMLQRSKMSRAGAMAIGEFGGAPAATSHGGPMLATPLYWLYEMSHAALDPARALRRCHPPVLPRTRPIRCPTRRSASRWRRLRAVRALDPPLRQARMGHRARPWSAASACRCRSPTVWERPFCRLLHFERAFEHPPRRPQPRLLIVAPMSGHYATLLRGTVEAFLPNHDVYITEWIDARMVPLSDGPLRSRRLHRLRDLDAAPAGRRHPCASRCASRRCRCSPPSPAWRPRTIPTCRIPWC